MKPPRIGSASFVRLWTGSTAAGLATWGLPFVLGLAALDGTITAAWLGITLGVRTVGFLVAMPFAGVLADRAGRRRVVLGASLIAAAGIPAMVAGLALPGTAGIVMLLAGSVAAGVGQGASRPAFQALVPLVVGPAGLQAANAAMSISVRVTNLIGPLAAAAAATTFGVGPVLWCLALLWLVSGFAPPSPPETGATTRTAKGAAGFLRELGAGLAEARRHPWFVAGLMALTAVIAAGYSVTGVILPLVSRDHHGGPVLLTASVTAYTLGALVAAFGIAAWKPSNRGRVALAGLALYGLVPLSLLLPASILVPVIAFFAAGVGIEVFNVLWFTAIQQEVAPDKLARVSSVDFLFSYGLAPVGLAAIAPLAGHFGQVPVLLACGAICLAAPLLAMLAPGGRTFLSPPRP